MYALLRALRAGWAGALRRRAGVRADRHRGLAGEAGARRQALRVRAGAARAARPAAGGSGPAPERLWLAGAHGGARTAEPALPDDLLPAGRLRDLDAVSRASRSRPARATPPLGRAALGSPAASGPCCSGLGIAAIQILPFLAVHPVFAARRRDRRQHGLGIRHRLLHAAGGDRHHGAAAVQRRAGHLLGPELLQAPHRISSAPWS